MIWIKSNIAAFWIMAIEEPLGPEPPEEPVMVMSEEVGLYEDDHL